MRVRFLIVMLFVVMMAPQVIAQGPPPPELTGDIVLEGLNGPQGLFIDEAGDLWVVDGGFGGEEVIQATNPNTFEVQEATLGQTSQIIRLTPGGEPEVVAMLPSVAVGEDALGGARLAVMNGQLYATVGGWHINSGEEVSLPHQAEVVAIGADGAISTVADLWAHELAENPDGTANIESHPFGIIAGPDGLLVVADAAANALVAVDPVTGETSTIAVFEGLPGVFPNPWRDNELVTDPVPTAVVMDGEGRLFVSLLSGAPFIPGSASVVEVSADGAISEHAPGQTMLTDLKLGPDGNLYAVSFGMFTEEGPVFNSGSVVRILPDGTSEVVIEGLPFATAIALDAAGNGYVAINGVAIPQAGMVVYYEGLTGMEGHAPEMMGG
ncbi:MAG: ScyD/ScyE family protein [Anaerolineae bacterium]|nr:ScyD/ScyE family protein [Anaerolineae bacterium]